MAKEKKQKSSVRKTKTISFVKGKGIKDGKGSGGVAKGKSGGPR